MEDYSQIIIADVVILELSGFKNARLGYNATAQQRRDKKIASQTMSMIEDYKLKYKGKVIQKETKQYGVSKNLGVSEKDQRIVELAKDMRKQTSRVIDVIHIDKDIPLLADETINTLYLEFDHLERYDVAASQMNLDAYLPDGMTLLISCIRCNEPEKVEERGGRFIPEPLIQKKLVFLLEHDADPNKTDSHQYCHTSLMIACFLGKEKWVRKLCSYPDICINSQDCNGYTLNP